MMKRSRIHAVLRSVPPFKVRTRIPPMTDFLFLLLDEGLILCYMRRGRVFIVHVLLIYISRI